MIKIVISKTINNLLLFFLIILASALFLYLLLIEGFTLDSIEYKNYKISQLYIKLDKKLQIRIKNIKIQKNDQSKISQEDIEHFFKYLEYTYSFIDEISIDSLSYSDKKYKVLYKHGEFFISNELFQIFAKLHKREKVMKLEIKKLLLNNYEASISGELTTYNNFSYASFESIIEVAKTKWKANLFYKDGILRYDLKSNTATSIEPLMKLLESHIDIDDEISSWIYKKIKAKSYEIKYLKGLLNTKTMHFDPNQLYAKGLAKNVSVYFHQKTSPVKIEKIDLEIIDNSLKFHITNPTYKDINIDGSYVQIDNLFTSGSNITVDIKAKNAKLDKDINQILKAFGIDFGLEQISGKTDANVILNIQFLPYKIKSKGVYRVKQGSFRYLDSIDFNITDAHISHNENIVLIDKGNLKFKNIIDTNISNGILNLETKKYKSLLQINSATLQKKENKILDIKNEIMPLEVDYSQKNDLKIYLPKIPLEVDIKDGIFYFIVNDLTISKKYFPLQKKYFIQDGNIVVETDDFENYFITLNASKIKTPLIKNNKPISSLHLDIAIDKKNIVGIDRFEGLEFIYNDTLDLSLYNFDINMSKTSSMIQSFTSKTTINAYNSKAILNTNSKVIFDKAKVILENNSTTIDLTYKSGTLSYTQNSNTKSFKMTKMDQNFVKSFLNFDEFDGGIYSANGYMDENEILNIDFDFEDAYVKDSTVFNDFLSFINTIPSLATFNENYFDKQGYLIKNGFIKVQVKNDLLVFKEIKLQGINADFVGSGYANLKNKTINLTMQMSTFKHIGKIVSAIPIAGYLILGKDGTIGASFDVKGTFDNPKIITKIAEDGILAPVNIFKRILTLPIKIFENKQDANSKKE